MPSQGCTLGGDIMGCTMDYKNDQDRIRAVFEDEKMMSKAQLLVPDWVEVHKKIQNPPVCLYKNEVEI